MPEPEIPPIEGAVPARASWLQGMAVAGRTFAVVLGTGGLGLLAGLCYGAWAASNVAAGGGSGAPVGELVTLAAWVISLVFCGAAGFLAGLATGILIMILVWIVRLAKRLTAGVSGGV